MGLATLSGCCTKLQLRAAAGGACSAMGTLSRVGAPTAMLTISRALRAS